MPEFCDKLLVVPFLNLTEAMRTLALIRPQAGLLSPELMRKMRLLLNRYGKNVDLDPGLSARLGFPANEDARAIRQLAWNIGAQSGERHSFSGAAMGQSRIF